MKNFKNKYKKLYKSYKLRLKKLYLESIGFNKTPLDYFVANLEFLRDQHLLMSPLTENIGTGNVRLASLVAALTEYQQYKTCITNYYIVNGKSITRRPEFSEEAARIEFQKERQQHWDAFWNLVKFGIEDWEIND